MKTAPTLKFVSLSRDTRSVADMVDAAGTGCFGSALMNYLQSACGADYCAVFRVDPQAPLELITGSHDGSQTARSRVEQYMHKEYWFKDPAMDFVRTRLAGPDAMLMRVDVNDLPDDEARETIWPRIRDRLVVAGRSHHSTYSVSVLREGRGNFVPAEIQRLGASADLLISVLAKHGQLSRGSADIAGVIKSLPDIETCIAALSVLTKRETEVCARILYGLTTTGIALDLNVSSETVKTFRKLAYRRLGIGSERELLQWYLGLRDRWQHVISA